MEPEDTQLMPVRTLLRVPIHFSTAGGRTTHAPMVLATVGGVRTRLILDTGADVHLLTRELAEAAGLALESLDAGTDHAGATMDSWTIPTARVTLDETDPASSATLRDLVAIPAPAAFGELGIGGGLSPQRLHPSAFAVIDQIADELLLVDEPSATIADWMLRRRPAPDVLLLSRRPGFDIPIVDAAIEPHPAAAVLVNTGGRHTEFDPMAVPGLSVGAIERIGTGVSGAAVMGGSAGRQILSVAGRRIEVPTLWLRSEMGDPPAMIGQDLLRGTVVAVGPDPSTPVLWQVATLESEAAAGS